MKLLFIIGMQKSGTSLFNRLLMEQDFICNPFLPEGKFFWGDDPPFSPTAKPCGELFQKHQGKRGHYLNDNDFSVDDQMLLYERIKKANINEQILMNKNPYNSVRIKWLKKIFPQSVIVAVYRNPVSNIYSLLKRYDKRNTQGVKPENGWWGIKPEYWKEMISKDKLLQSTMQWNVVNESILSNIKDVDLLINYEDICKNPTKAIENAIANFDIKMPIKKYGEIKNMNDECLTGCRLSSKNKELRNNAGFNLSNLVEEIEFPRFSKSQINKINHLTKKIWNQLSISNKNYY